MKSITAQAHSMLRIATAVEGKYAIISSNSSCAWDVLVTSTGWVDNVQVRHAKREVQLPNGSVVQVIDYRQPEKLRGHHFDALITDEYLP